MSEMKMRATAGHVYFVSGPFSQWHPSAFTAALPALVTTDGGWTVKPCGPARDFSHAEQAMMASKAAIFEDYAMLDEILAAKSPKKQKELGRSVAGFDSAIWSTVSYRIVAVMNFHKFTQDAELQRILLDTGDKHIVEGAWYDPIWGVGLAWDDPDIDDAKNWKGTNWLGEVLMAVRGMIRDGETASDPWVSPRLTTAPPG
jgi:ribA/ribD-fused uncharacterized protein